MIDMRVLKALRNGREWAFCIWEPLNVMVVVGRGGTVEKEVLCHRCKKDGIPIYQRRTGGGTVVLSPGMLVFSVGKKIEKPLAVQKYNRVLTEFTANFFNGLGVEKMEFQGEADLAIGNRKIMGSGMYMSKQFLFYQASILVEPDVSLMKKYLPHPPREPEYRKNRSHDSFVTTLREQGYDFNVLDLKKKLCLYLLENIERIR
ncbi:MAG: biotin/lipoate A/B protein ligase family protein [Vulcanimicrobiota bacterium]